MEIGYDVSSQLAGVLQILRYGEWVTPDEIAAQGVAGGSSSITARCRDLRKPPHSFVIECRRRAGGRGVCEYRLSPTQNPDSDWRW